MMLDELRDHAATLRALSATLTEVDARLGDVTLDWEPLQTRLRSIRGGLATHAAGLADVAGEIDDLGDAVSGL